MPRHAIPARKRARGETHTERERDLDLGWRCLGTFSLSTRYDSHWVSRLLALGLSFIVSLPTARLADRLPIASRVRDSAVGFIRFPFSCLTELSEYRWESPRPPIFSSNTPALRTWDLLPGSGSTPGKQTALTSLLNERPFALATTIFFFSGYAASPDVKPLLGWPWQTYSGPLHPLSVQRAYLPT
ncbi:hypothetical protein LX32DRAFT_644523 [Colletotrichum zoysiae]|uniref:Uncharacterized protein n=1 Tax=Colletotrichum zoysiae TaxID=1216348 RepID=A0AAD9H8J7_9PEZI|nr:hypothetical protein LX32DRAFT_644523 [Colletotrichum zoysiae]